MMITLGQKKCPFRHFFSSSRAIKRNFPEFAIFCEKGRWDEVHVCLTVGQKDPPILVFIFIYSLISTLIHLSLWGSFVCLVHSREAGLCSGAGVPLQESSCSTFPAPPKFYLAPAIPTSTAASTPGGERSLLPVLPQLPIAAPEVERNIPAGAMTFPCDRHIDYHWSWDLSKTWLLRKVTVLIWGGRRDDYVRGRSLAAENHLSLLPALGAVDLDWEYKSATQNQEKVFWNRDARFAKVILWCQQRSFENGGVFMDSRCLSIHNSW